MFSDNLSETRKSLRSSTDDLLLPRVNGSGQLDHVNEPSHWHSTPLGLALLPAVGGLLFQDGSAVVTDITLLALAAIFLNWSVRLPWDWYRSAQATKSDERGDFSTFETIAEEKSDEEDHDHAAASQQDKPTPKSSQESNWDQQYQRTFSIEAAQKELRIHELLALLSCFLFPVIGAWLLHAIRGQLSRPSEGLVSNYNLTVFLLASEIRPVSHLVKMIQARTLFLQKVSGGSPTDDEQRHDPGQVIDLVRRVEELEAHIADTVETSSKSVAVATDVCAAKTAAQAVSETRKCLQPDLDALNRAVRRYEKRTTVSSLQTEARLQDLECQLKDVVVLAAAAQRNAEQQPRNYMLILLNWTCALVVVPAQYAWAVLRLPIRAAEWAVKCVRRFFGFRQAKKLGQTRQGNQIKSKERSWKVGF